MKWVKIFNIIVLTAFAIYGIYLFVMKEFYDKTVLDCKSKEFITTNCFLIAILNVFLYFAI